MRIKIITFLASLVFPVSVYGQISPPGLGDSNTAEWLAFGVRQYLDSAGHKQSFTYVGMGRISTPADNNPYRKPAIVVVNQEFYHQFHKHWQYSLALSYRDQNEYEDTPPYDKSSPETKQEFRIYGRYSYVWTKSRVKFVTTFRQEFRKFFTPDFQNWEESIQLRSRIRSQFIFTLNKNKTQRLVATAEALFSTSKENSSPKTWSDFEYHESRFCLYYSLSPKKQSFTYNIGYMNNLLGKTPLKSVHYLAFDIIWENPFYNPKREKKKTVESTQ